MDYTSLVAVISLFIVAPLIVFSFVYLSKRDRARLEELKLKKEMLALEVEKERAHTQLLEAENAKYDRMIEGKS